MVLNTDKLDPPCTDIYTNVATQLGDAYFFFPMMYNHFDESYSQGRGNDGTLEARMAVSRHGGNLTYVDRGAWLPRGGGMHRATSTGVYEGRFDAGATAVVAGIVQSEDETVMYGWGTQYTHGGYVGFTEPPCRGKGPGPCAVHSGIQALRLRKNGFVSLSTTSNTAMSPGIMRTVPFTLPICTASAWQQTLQLNIFTAIGLGASIDLTDAADGMVVARSAKIEGGSVAYNVSWQVQGTPTRQWVDGGCAYEAKGTPPDKCGRGDRYESCTTRKDCLSPENPVIPGTCNGVHVDCLKGICQTGATGGEACGKWANVSRWVDVGSNLKSLGLGLSQKLAIALTMGAGDLYSVQVLCG